MPETLLGPMLETFNLIALVGGGVLATGATIAVLPRVVGLVRQRSYERATERDRLRWVLRPDPNEANDPDAIRRLVAALHPAARRGVSRWASGWPPLTVAMTWTGQRARWEIEAPRQLERGVQAAVAAALPTSEFEAVVRPERVKPRQVLGVRGEAPTGEGRRVSGFGTLLAEVLARLPPGAEAAWTLRLAPLPDGVATRSADGGGWAETLLDSFLNRRSRSPTRTLELRVPVSPRFTVTASLEVSSAPPSTMRAWLFDAVAVIGALHTSGWRIQARVGARPVPMQVDATDVAELWGLAGAASDARPVEIVRSRRLPAPAADPASDPRAIGRNGARPVHVPDGLLARHALLLGRTGSGKSTEMVALAADDLRAGRGFTFIDPHGDAVARLLDAVPDGQTDRVHLLELAEKDKPRGFNPIELDGADPELVAAQFVDTMRDLYFARLSSPPHRQLQYLRSALMTLLTQPPDAGSPWTLESLNRLFVDPRFRETILLGVDDPMLTAFWTHQWPQKGRGSTDASADALISKLSAFLSYPSIRAIVSAPVSTIRPRRIMDGSEVLLVDLSRTGGDNAWLFGGLVIARYYVDALGRQGQPPDRRVPHTLYVDEVQNFDTTALRDIPAQGRKFALRLVMATQYLESLGRELQRSIRANVATIMLLQPSAEDARLLRDVMAPLTERDLVNLPRFRMAVRTEIDGDPRVLTADILPEAARLGSAAVVRRHSDARDARRGTGEDRR